MKKIVSLLKASINLKPQRSSSPCSDQAVIRSVISHPNAKFKIIKEVHSQPTSENQLEGEASNDDSSVNVSSEEPDFIVESLVPEKKDNNFGREVAVLFQIPSIKKAPHLPSCKFVVIDSLQIPPNLSTFIEDSGLLLGRAIHHQSQ